MNPDENEKTTRADCPTSCGCCRDNAQSMLGRLIERKAKYTEAMRVLMQVIPWNLLTHDQEELLWEYFAHKE